MPVSTLVLNPIRSILLSYWTTLIREIFLLSLQQQGPREKKSVTCSAVVMIRPAGLLATTDVFDIPQETKTLHQQCDFAQLPEDPK